MKGTARAQWDNGESELDDDFGRRRQAAEEQNRKLEQDARNQIAAPGKPQLLIRRGDDPNQDERAGRITMALAVIPMLGVGLVASLLAMSPIGYPGGLVLGVGAAWSSAVTVEAVLVLAAMSVRRMSGRRLLSVLGFRAGS